MSRKRKSDIYNNHNIKGKWVASKVIGIIGYILILVSVSLFVIFNFNLIKQYTAKLGLLNDDLIYAEGNVIRSNEQIDTNDQSDGSIDEVMYHLVISYIHKGRVSEFVLNEAYLTVEEADSHIGEKRSVIVDSNTNMEVQKPSVVYFPLFIMLFGILLNIGKSLYQYRYHDIYNNIEFRKI